MPPVFADTFYFLALLNSDDQAHKQAVAASTPLKWPLVTTYWVLTELGDALASSGHRMSFHNTIQTLRQNRMVTIVPSTIELFNAAVELYHDRPDKDWPLTDCVSFVVMKERGIAEALTGDRHFEQAGFTALLK
jgi:uncharacterized protein